MYPKFNQTPTVIDDKDKKVYITPVKDNGFVLDILKSAE